MQRRDFIKVSTGLAGLALLAPACKTLRPVPGRIVGASSSIGHLIRDGQFPAPVSVIKKDVVIVGGGISGLSAARWLQRNNITDGILFDLEDHVGGNASSGRNAVSAYPWGAHYIPTPNNGLTEYHAFLEECGVITGHDEQGLPVYNEFYLCADPQERLYINGRWQDGLVPGPGLSQRDQNDIRRFQQLMQQMREAKGADGMYAFDIPVDNSSKDDQYRRLDHITMKQWLEQQQLDSPYLHWYANYCTRDDFGTRYDQISAWVGIHYHAGRRGKGANAHHYDTLTWPQGNGWLVEQLCKPIGSWLRPNALVIRVTPGDDHVEIQYMDTNTRAVHAVEAKQVVMAVPQFVGSRLLPSDPPRIAMVRQHMHYTPWVVANLTVRDLEERSGVPLSWDNVIYESSSLGYVEATHQHLEQLREKMVLTWYAPLTAADPAGERARAQRRTHSEWTDLIIEDLEKVHPDIRRQTDNIDIMIWGHAMVQPRPAWIDGPVRKRLQQAASPRVHFAHTDLAGISIFEEGFYQGIGAAKKILTSI